MDTDGARNQELLSWQLSAEIYWEPLWDLAPCRIIPSRRGVTGSNETPPLVEGKTTYQNS
jgi:hypothetical protein